MTTPPATPPHQPDTFTHAKSLERLRSFGWTPRTIYDIGAFQGYWSKAHKAVFPDSEFILFEANSDNEAKLALRGFRYFIGPLGAEDGEERTFFLPKTVNATGASLYREKTAF